MLTPSRPQALSHYERQRSIAARAVAVVRQLFKGNAPLTQIAATVAAFQHASATASSRTIAAFASDSSTLTNAAAFTGVSSAGYSIVEPIIATIDRIVPAPVEALPANWWTDAEVFMSEVEQLIVSEINDAGRSASQVEFVTRPEWTNYVRMLNPPSCARCAVLAGRIYRDLEAFARHPNCDCVMVPVENWQDAHDAGLVVSPDRAFRDGRVRGLSQADSRAVADGANLTEVVNATRGTSAPGITNAISVEVFGHKVKATTYGTTARAKWRKAHPSVLVRLRPESIYAESKNRDDAIRLLGLHGYITP